MFCRLAIVGVTDQYIHYKTTREKYIEDVLTLQTHVSRLNHRYFTLGLFQKKIPGVGGGGRRQTIYFSMGFWCIHFFKLYGSLVFEKTDYMGGGVLSENRKLTFDRYIKSNVPVSIKISNPNLPVFLVCEIIQSTHKLIYFV